MIRNWLSSPNLRLVTSSLLAVTLLSACDPKEKYKKVIEDEGYIPYLHPIDRAGAGVLQFQNSNSADNIILVDDRGRCFPKDTGLWQDSEIDLANRVNRFSLGFNVAANSILIAGNTNMSFNLGAKFVKSVDVKFEGAKLEEVDLFALEDFYPQMDERCKKKLDQVPFVYKALKVSAMEFIFRRESGVHIDLDVKVVSQILNIKAGVDWEIGTDLFLVEI